MKKIFTYAIAFSAIFLSCNEDDAILFNPDNVQDTILNVATSTSETQAFLNIDVNETASVDIMLQSSTRLSQDRSFSVTIVEEETDADPIYYNLPSSIVIPANEFIGTLTIDGQDPVGDIISQTLTIDISDGTFTERFVVNVSVLGPFAGSFQLDVVEGVFPGFGATGSYASGGLVNIEFISEEERRITDLCYLVDLGTFCGPFDFNVVGDQIVVPLQAPGGGVGCGAAILSQSFPDDQATVDVNDDSVFQIIFQDNVDNAGQCDVDDYRVVFQLTKQ